MTSPTGRRTQTPERIEVWLICPACGEEWHEATIQPGAWWSEGSTPETIAKRTFCINDKCDAWPPMKIRASQPDLFGGVVSENTERGTA